MRCIQSRGRQNKSRHGLRLRGGANIGMRHRCKLIGGLYRNNNEV